MAHNYVLEIYLTYPIQPPMMVDDIENGCAFYFTEEDYLPAEELSLTPSKKYAKRRHRSNTKHRASINEAVKTEKSASPVGLGVAGPSSAPVTPTPSSGKKRPRRSAAASTKKYVDPDSDDDMIVDDCDKIVYEATCDVKKRRVETSLQKWIKHLTALLQVEQKKVSWTRLLLCDQSNLLTILPGERAEEGLASFGPSGCQNPRCEGAYAKPHALAT